MSSRDEMDTAAQNSSEKDRDKDEERGNTNGKEGISQTISDIHDGDKEATRSSRVEDEVERSEKGVEVANGDKNSSAGRKDAIVGGELDTTSTAASESVNQESSSTSVNLPKTVPSTSSRPANLESSSKPPSTQIHPLLLSEPSSGTPLPLSEADKIEMVYRPGPSLAPPVHLEMPAAKKVEPYMIDWDPVTGMPSRRVVRAVSGDKSGAGAAGDFVESGLARNTTSGSGMESRRLAPTAINMEPFTPSPAKSSGAMNLSNLLTSNPPPSTSPAKMSFPLGPPITSSRSSAPLSFPYASGSGPASGSSSVVAGFPPRYHSDDRDHLRMSSSSASSFADNRPRERSGETPARLQVTNPQWYGTPPDGFHHAHTRPPTFNNDAPERWNPPGSASTSGSAPGSASRTGVDAAFLAGVERFHKEIEQNRVAAHGPGQHQQQTYQREREREREELERHHLDSLKGKGKGREMDRMQVERNGYGGSYGPGSATDRVRESVQQDILNSGSKRSSAQSGGDLSGRVGEVDHAGDDIALPPAKKKRKKATGEHGEVANASLPVAKTKSGGEKRKVSAIAPRPENGTGATYGPNPSASSKNQSQKAQVAKPEEVRFFPKWSNQYLPLQYTAYQARLAYNRTRVPLPPDLLANMPVWSRTRRAMTSTLKYLAKPIKTLGGSVDLDAGGLARAVILEGDVGDKQYVFWGTGRSCGTVVLPM